MTRLLPVFAAALLFSGVATAQSNSTLGDTHGAIYVGGATLTKKVGGRPVWEIPLGAGPSAILAVAQAPDGQIYAAGRQASGGFLARVSPAGARLAQVALPALARAMAVDPHTGNVYAAGDGYLAVYPPDLSSQISQAATGSSATAIAIDSAGAVYLAGTSGGLGRVQALQPTVQAGFQTVWHADLGASSPAAMAVDPAGALLVAGATSSNHAFVAKLSPAGELLWSTNLGGSGMDAATFLTAAEANLIAVGGSTASPDFPRARGAWNGADDGFLAWLNSSGEVLASQYTGTAGDERLQTLAAVRPAAEPRLAGGGTSITVDGVTCTLGLAIAAANTGVGTTNCPFSGSGTPYTIQLPANATYTYSTPDNFWYGPNALPPIATTIVIEGNGSTLQISQAKRLRFFYVGASIDNPGTPSYNSPGAGNLTLHNLTLTGGVQVGGTGGFGGGGAGMGGAIFNQGILTLTGVTLTGNRATGGRTQLSNANGGGGLGADADGVTGGGFGGAVTPAGSKGGDANDISGTGGGGGGFGVNDDASNTGAGGGTADGLGGLGVGTSAGNGSGGGGQGPGAGFPGIGGGFGAGGGGGANPASDGDGGGGVGGGGAGGGRGGGGGFGGGGGASTGVKSGSGGGFGGGGGVNGFGGFGAGQGALNAGGGGAGMGGAIFNHNGAIQITGCYFTGNTAAGGLGANNGQGLGGAIFNLNGAVTVNNTTISENTADDGGAVYNLGYNLHANSYTADLILQNSILANSVTAAHDLVNDQPTFVSGAAGGGANAAVAEVLFGGQNVVLTSNNSNGTVLGGVSGCVTNPVVWNLADSLNAATAGSLRFAVGHACPNSTITFSVIGTIPLNGTILLGQNLQNVDIQGPGAAKLTISGQNANRIFFVQATDTTTNISGVTLANGYAQGSNGGPGGAAAGMGGAIFQFGGSLNVAGVIFSGNRAVGGSATGASPGGAGFGGSGSGGSGGSGGYLGGIGGAFSQTNGTDGGIGAGGGPGVQNGGNGGFAGGGGQGTLGSGGHGGFGGGGGQGGLNGGAGTFGGGDASFSAGGGGAGFGGAIFAFAGTLSLVNTSFQNNSASGGTGNKNGDGRGGALFLYQETATAAGVTFSGSTAASAGTNTHSGFDYNGGLVSDGATVLQCPGQDTADICGTLAIPILTVAKTHTGPGSGNAFVVGQTGSYIITVGNSSSTSTGGATVTLTDPLPAGFTQSNIAAGADWNCATSTPTLVTCTNTTSIANNQTYSNVVVTVTPGLTAGTSVTNTATATANSMGAGTGTGSDAAATVIHPAILSLSNSDNNSATYNQGDTGKTATFTLSNDTVSNGAGPTSSAVTLTFTISSGLSLDSVSPASGFNCAGTTTISCSSNASPVLAAGSSAAFTVHFHVAGNASIQQTILASVSGGGGNAATNTDTLAILPPGGCIHNSVVADLTDAPTAPTVTSLRFAVLNTCPGGTISFAVNGTIPLAAPIVLTKSVTIQGPGAARLTISGENASRIFFVGSGDLTPFNGTVNMSDVTLAKGLGIGGNGGPGGAAAGMGGAIFQNGGTLNVANAIFSGNQAVGGLTTSGGFNGGGGFGGNGGSTTGGGGGYLGGVAGAFAGDGGPGGGGGPGNQRGGSGGFGGGGGIGYFGPSGNGGFGGGGGEGNPGGAGGFGGGNGGKSNGGGGAGFGGAIFANIGFLSLANTSFVNNSASGGTGIQNGDGRGGALFVYLTATVAASGVTFSGNTAANAGQNTNSNLDYNGNPSGNPGAVLQCPGQDTVNVCTVQPPSPCDIAKIGFVTVSDVQLMVNEALGQTQAVNDMNHDGIVNVVDVQIVIGGVLGVCMAQ